MYNPVSVSFSDLSGCHWCLFDEAVILGDIWWGVRCDSSMSSRSSGAGTRFSMTPFIHGWPCHQQGIIMQCSFFVWLCYVCENGNKIIWRPGGSSRKIVFNTFNALPCNSRRESQLFEPEASKAESWTSFSSIMKLRAVSTKKTTVFIKFGLNGSWLHLHTDMCPMGPMSARYETMAGRAASKQTMHIESSPSPLPQWKHMCQSLNSLYWGWSSHLQ